MKSIKNTFDLYKNIVFANKVNLVSLGQIFIRSEYQLVGWIETSYPSEL